MKFFDYKAVPAPRRSKKSRGVSDHSELFALTLTEAINEHAREGWEYVRAESMAAEAPSGLFKRAVEETIQVLIFRRERATLGPEIETAQATQVPSAPTWEPSHEEPEEPFREPGLARREPVVADIHPEAAAHVEDTPPPSPLRPAPSLGPASRD